jgi:hypothetical protein
MRGWSNQNCYKANPGAVGTSAADWSTQTPAGLIYRLAIVTAFLLPFQPMPIRYREVLEYMQGYLAAYPLGFQADETGQQYIVADRNGYRLGESADPRQIEEMVKSENEAFTNNMHRKTFRELIAMFAS